jgi:hypothetical protein
VVVSLPDPKWIGSVRIDGQEAPHAGGEVRINKAPATVEVQYRTW